MVPTRAAAGGVVGRPVVGRCHRVGRGGCAGSSCVPAANTLGL